jgi:hypothetical protein
MRSLGTRGAAREERLEQAAGERQGASRLMASMVNEALAAGACIGERGWQPAQTTTV